MTTYTPSATWVNATTQITYDKLDHIDQGIKDLVDESQNTEYGCIGLISPWAGAGTIPTGWAVCDGTAVLRADFPKLFDIIGTTYGAGDGSTTFNLPNFVGLFVRGLDEGRGIDDGGGARAVGSVEEQMIKIHPHPYSYHTADSGGPTLNTSGAAGGYYVSLDTTSSGSYGGADQRPKNYAMRYLIRTG